MEMVALGFTFGAESDPVPDSPDTDGAKAEAAKDPKPDSDGGAGGPIKVVASAEGLAWAGGGGGPMAAESGSIWSNYRNK